MGGHDILRQAVVQVIRDGASLFLLRRDQAAHQGTLPGELMQVMDGDGGMCAQCLHRDLIRLGKFAAALLIGQIEAAQHRVAAPDRNAQKTLHRGMVGRKPDGLRVIRQNRHAQGVRPREQQSQNARSFRTGADGGLLFGGQARRHELQQALSIQPRYAQSGIARVGKRPRCFRDMVQGLRSGLARHNVERDTVGGLHDESAFRHALLQLL